MLNIAAVCIVITALLAYLHHRFIKMPTTVWRPDLAHRPDCGHGHLKPTAHAS